MITKPASYIYRLTSRQLFRKIDECVLKVQEQILLRNSELSISLIA